MSDPVEAVARQLATDQCIRWVSCGEAMRQRLREQAVRAIEALDAARKDAGVVLMLREDVPHGCRTLESTKFGGQLVLRPRVSDPDRRRVLHDLGIPSVAPPTANLPTWPWFV